MTDKKMQNNATKFFCEKCDYTSCNKYNFEKHLQTRKHKYLHNTDEKMQKMQNEFNCICGKSYKYRQSLYTHKKKCMFKDKESISQNLSQEFVLDVIKKQQDQITELTNTIKEMAPLINNTTNNTQNNKFNINVFLNEKCKDAINMSDFIKSIEVSIEQLDFTKQNGLANGLSKTILDNMNKLSVFERPLHCTDIKRETLYIKDENEWTKDASREKLKRAIKKASGKNYNALQDWKNENPDFLNNDSKTDYFTNTIRTIGKTDSTIEEKIIKNICKETYIK